MGFTYTLKPYLKARFGIRENVGHSKGTETSNVIFYGLPSLAKTPRARKLTHPYITGECLSLHIIYFLHLQARILF